MNASRSYVEEANNQAPAWARLFKEAVLIADPSKPFARAAKGTAIRSLVLKSYESEINEMLACLLEFHVKTSVLSHCSVGTSGLRTVQMLKVLHLLSVGQSTKFSRG